jgi:MFS family permease
MNKSNRSFKALMVTQFLGAFNDNVFQIVIALLITHWMSEEKARSLVAISGAVFAAPFLIFSLGAGRLADRWSKARVVVLAKTVDLGVVALLVAGLYFKNVPLLLTGLFLLATQSAFFSPAKYGLIPGIKRSLPTAVRQRAVERGHVRRHFVGHGGRNIFDHPHQRGGPVDRRGGGGQCGGRPGDRKSSGR